MILSIAWFLKPISYDELRSRHQNPNYQPIVRDVTSSSLETEKKKCLDIEDFFFSEPNELESLESSDQVILPRIIDSPLYSKEPVRLDNNKLDIKAKT